MGGYGEEDVAVLLFFRFYSVLFRLLELVQSFVKLSDVHTSLPVFS